MFTSFIRWVFRIPKPVQHVELPAEPKVPEPKAVEPVTAPQPVIVATTEIKPWTGFPVGPDGRVPEKASVKAEKNSRARVKKSKPVVKAVKAKASKPVPAQPAKRGRKPKAA